MSNATRRSLRGFAETLVRLGIATDDQVATGLAEAADIGMDLDEEADDPEELTFLVGDCGLGFQTQEKASGGLAEAYEEVLTGAAACSGGAVVVDRVTLRRDEDGGEYLYVRRNGRALWYRPDHLSETTRYVDWNVLFEAVADLVPGNGDPRRFHQLDEDSYDAHWLLLTAEQADGLREFGLPLPVDLGSDVRDGLPTAPPETAEWYLQDDRLRASEESRRRLDAWLAAMDTALRDWRAAHLPADFPYDRTPDSLTALAELLLARHDGPEVLDADPLADDFLQGAIRYIGETALRHGPCRWTYRYTAADAHPWVFDNQPLIRSNTPDEFSDHLSPELELRTLLTARAPHHLRDRLSGIGASLASYRTALRARERPAEEW
ncbi:hypothetical protein ACWGB8_21340 [Kitasatospora sp. NPDC054939]